MRTRQIETGWRSGDRRTIAVVRPGTEELAASLGIAWQRAHDELDRFDYAVLEAPSGRVFALRRYEGMPTPGTELVVDLDLSRPECELDEALGALGLTRDDVTWRLVPQRR